MRQITLDGNMLADAANVHDYLIDKLDFPKYYGKNFDALYDCLTDLINTEIMIITPSEDGAVFQKVLRVFKAADRNNKTLKITLL